MLTHQFLNPPQFLWREAQISSEANRLQPELGRQIIPINMHVWRLVRFMAVEVESERAGSQDSRHGIDYLTSSSGRNRTSNVVPPSAAEVNVIAPPWASTMLLLIANPSPLPPESRDRSLDTR